MLAQPTALILITYTGIITNKTIAIHLSCNIYDSEYMSHWIHHCTIVEIISYKYKKITD